MWTDDVIDKWIHEKNPTPEAYAAASRAFMLSCAGYSVATYVLGRYSVCHLGGWGAYVVNNRCC